MVYERDLSTVCGLWALWQSPLMRTRYKMYLKQGNVSTTWTFPEISELPNY